ncbi:sporadic carbohydrate cluster 2OG-Fe(II) oxygenase [Candidatus Pelagibacter bacterium nBUS_32]|uniref:sporadic carbohydrate cluster 2OG-Fe(II) oxygenase n=1 Tax=Candidatus Pelagibacter bacterium nBUS_32 TaxID=3374192 RepID=UPI003EB8A2C5
MSPKFSKFENKIIKDFNRDGFIIFDIKEKKTLLKIKKLFEKKIHKISKKKKIKIYKDKDILNNFHKYLNFEQLNDFRFQLYNSINDQKWFLDEYFCMGKKYLEVICGNELAMQRKVNLSIQLPKDDSSLLPIHSDVWSGCSAYEVVLWIPMVDVSKTKSMFILPRKTNEIYYKKFNKYKDTNSLQKAIDKKVKWLNIKFGQGLIFAHHLMHGNKVNITNETRWSFNCRFKSLMSPYDKKDIAETFFPLIVRPATRVGLEYEHPQI